MENCWVGYVLTNPDPSNLSLQYLGYKPFVEACVEANEKEEALKYIPKLADPRERAEVSNEFKLSEIEIHTVVTKFDKRGFAKHSF